MNLATSSSRHLAISPYLAGVLVAIAVLAAWWWSQPAPSVAIDLIAELPNATQRRPSPDAFTTQDVTIAGDGRPAIVVAEQSRLTWEQTVPQDGWLQVRLGVREEAWAREGSGVLFMVGVSHEGRYEELVNVVLDPFTRPSDRQWLPVLLDLAPWAGQRIEIILNTRVAPDTPAPSVHLPAWGAPAIVTR